MGEEKTETDVARASEVGNNLPQEPVESVIHKEQESLTKNGNDENVGIEESIEAKICNQNEDSEGKECNSKKLLVEGNKQTAAVPREDAEMVIVTKDTEEPIEGETKEVVELEGEKNDAVEQDSKEHETTEVVELEGEKNEVIEQNNEPQEVVPLEFAGQDSEIRLTRGEDNEVKESDASERISKATVEDEAPKKEMLGGINLEAKEAGADGQVKAARDVNEAEMEDKNMVKEDQENQGDINKEKMEVELEPKADKSDNESIRAGINLEEKGLDVKNKFETEQVEGKLEGSCNEEDKQDDAKGLKKRKRKENAVAEGGKEEEESQKTPAISVSTRPVRERKSVERLVASVEKEVIREIFVEKGPGVALNDIPNVAYKLSKKTNDETFKQLHTILFGRRGKAIQMKNHLSQFSGFVWHDNEEKNKMKIREKLDKLVKEKLIEFCDVLDIPITNKVSTKKEDVVTKIMEFLASPHSTTDELLSEKEHSEKTTKRKRSVAPGSPTSGSGKSSRKRKRSSEKFEEGAKGESDKEDEALTENQGNGNGNLNQSEDESSEKKSSESEDAMDEDTTTHRKKRFKNTPVKVSAKRTKKSDLSESEEEKKGNAKSRRQSLNKSSDKGRSSKQVKDVPEKEPNNKTKNVEAKGKPKEEKLKPSDKVLRNQICQILKEVDFNTATFTDILKLLGKHFKTDLTPRKASIKLIIQEELTKIADAADEDDDDEEEEEEEQNVTAEAAKVKA